MLLHLTRYFPPLDECIKDLDECIKALDECIKALDECIKELDASVKEFEESVKEFRVSVKLFDVNFDYWFEQFAPMEFSDNNWKDIIYYKQGIPMELESKYQNHGLKDFTDLNPPFKIELF